MLIPTKSALVKFNISSAVLMPLRASCSFQHTRCSAKVYIVNRLNAPQGFMLIPTPLIFPLSCVPLRAKTQRYTRSEWRNTAHYTHIIRETTPLLRACAGVVILQHKTPFFYPPPRQPLINPKMLSQIQQRHLGWLAQPLNFNIGYGLCP